MFQYRVTVIFGQYSVRAFGSEINSILFLGRSSTEKCYPDDVNAQCVIFSTTTAIFRNTQTTNEVTTAWNESRHAKTVLY
jgi:hypothetical protein